MIPASFESKTVRALSISVNKEYVSVTLAEPLVDLDKISSTPAKLDSSVSSLLTISLSTSSGADPGQDTLI